MNLRRLTVVLLLSSLASLTGCGSSGDSSPTTPTDPTAVASGTVTPATGGQIAPSSGTAGPTMLVPAGAVTSTVTITVKTSSVPAPTGALSAVYAFGPDGTQFATPVTVRIPVPAGTSAATVYWTKVGSTTQFDALPTTLVGGYAVAQVTHFSLGFAGAPCTEGGSCSPSGNACNAGALACATGTPVCNDTGTAAADGTTCGGTNYCSAGVCSRTVTITNVESYWTAAGKTEVQKLDRQFAVVLGTPATPTGRIDAVQQAPGQATYVAHNVPLGSFWLESRFATGAPSYARWSADTARYGGSWWGRADGTPATLATPLTFDFSNMTPWTASIWTGGAGSGDTIEYFSANAGAIEYAFGEWGINPEEWAAGATSGSGTDDYSWMGGPLIDSSKGDTTYFTQLATKPATGTSLSYHAVDRYFLSDTFTIQDGVAQTFAVPFVPVPAYDTMDIDFRQSQFAPLLADANVDAGTGSGIVAVEAFPEFAPGVMWSRMGTVDLMYVDIPYGTTDTRINQASWGRFLPAPWKTSRWVSYTGLKSYQATGATWPIEFGLTAFFSREPVPGASNPIVPVLSPPRGPALNGTAASADRTGVGTTPVLSWSAPSFVPSATSVRYAVTIYRLSVVSGRTRRATVASGSWLSDPTFQIPAGWLTAGQQYFALISASAFDGDREYYTYTATGMFSP